eukprot:358727-Chlamydomonas_euryale.AAC.14
MAVRRVAIAFDAPVSASGSSDDSRGRRRSGTRCRCRCRRSSGGRLTPALSLDELPACARVQQGGSLVLQRHLLCYARVHLIPREAAEGARRLAMGGSADGRENRVAAPRTSGSTAPAAVHLPGSARRGAARAMAGSAAAATARLNMHCTWPERACSQKLAQLTLAAA